jgi:hypothetical protein
MLLLYQKSLFFHVALQLQLACTGQMQNRPDHKLENRAAVGGKSY